MGIFDRVERRLERAVNSVFARAFKAEVQPVEIASAIRKAMDDRAVTPSRGHVLVPNVFTVVLSSTDFDRLSEFEDDIVEELVVSAEEHVESQRYSPAGPISVTFETTDELETGVFRIKPSKAKRADRGRPAGEYAPRPSPAPPAYAGGRAAEGGPSARHGRDEDLGGWDPYGDNPYDAPHAGRATHGSAAPAAGSRRVHEEERQVVPRRTRPGDRPYLASREDRFLLMGAINVIGREDDSDIIFDDPGISRRHSEIRVTTDGPRLRATVRDLGSTNGTFVNGERISSQRLEDGDRITIGRTTVTYHAGRA